MFFANHRSAGLEYLEAIGFELAPVSGRIDPVELADLDFDLVIWNLLTKQRRAELDDDPRIQALAVMKEKRVVYLEDDVAEASNYYTVRSLPYLVDAIIPLLRAATS